MARKWSNRNLPGALHFVTGNVANRVAVFQQPPCSQEFFAVCAELRESRPFKLMAYVLMPDHFHLIVNSRDGDIRQLMGTLKSLSAQRVIQAAGADLFLRATPDVDGSTHQLWQESFKSLPLWSQWMIWQKIIYIHANPVKAKLVSAAKDYPWSSFRAFYSGEPSPVPIDKEWWWPDDVRKLSVAAAGWVKEMTDE